MPYGTGGNFDNNTKVISFNLKDKDLPAPHFEVSVKDENNQYIPQQPATRVSGNLVSVRHKENLYQGKAIRSVTVTLRDDGAKETYFVNIPYTYLGRNILNSLANLTAFDNVEISVYKGKPKVPGKPGFSSSAVKQNGQLIYGKVAYKDLPLIKKVQVGDQFYSDATLIDAFFKNLVETLTKNVAARAQAPAQEQEPVPAGAPEKDDLPF